MTVTAFRFPLVLLIKLLNIVVNLTDSGGRVDWIAETHCINNLSINLGFVNISFRNGKANLITIGRSVKF